MYYLTSDDRKLLEKLRRNQVCAECGGQLEAFYDLEKRLPYLQCKTNAQHEGIAKEYREPRELNIPTWRSKMEKEHGKETMNALAKYHPSEGRLTQSQAMHILKLVYPHTPEDEIIRCAILCQDFGLHPLKKEVYIIPFGQGEKRTWATVVGIAADRKIAATQKGAYSYLDDSPRATSKEEIVKQFGEDSEEAEKNIISICKVQGESGNQAVGFGLWPRASVPYGMDKGNTKRNMANIRAERQAVSRLPGKPLPQVEVIDAEYAELPAIVDITTGEIKEPAMEKKSPEQKPDAPVKRGEFADAKPEPVPAPPPDAPESKSEPPRQESNGNVPPEVTSPIDMAWLQEEQMKLLAKGQSSWDNKGIRDRIDKITGHKSKTVSEAVNHLTKEQAAEFKKKINEAVEMSQQQSRQ